MWSNWEHTPTIARSRPQMKEAVETDQSQQSWRLSTAVRDKTVTALADARIISEFLFSFVRALENTVSAPKAILILAYTLSTGLEIFSQPASRTNTTSLDVRVYFSAPFKSI